MIVSHALKLIFISNPKVASTSIEAAFETFHDGKELDEIFRKGYFTRRHLPAVEIRETISAHAWQNYFKVAFVRNPWDWFVSQYTYNLTKQATQLSPEKISESEVLNTYETLKKYRGTDWSESASQHQFVCDEQGIPLVDFVGRYENLGQDFKIVTDHLGLPNTPLRHLNRSNHSAYTEYYNDVTIDLIRKLYLKDVTTFGYDYG
jgi:hypothetical protein